MNSIIPPKLRPGNRIAVIGPARSMGVISPLWETLAIERFKSLGLDVVFSEHCRECDDFSSSSIEHRLDDLYWAFENDKIDAIFCVIGGFNSNQLLHYIDWDRIKAHPKIFSGFSDITAIGHAIFAKTGIITYSGPFFSSLGQKKHMDYTIEMMKKCLFHNEPFFIEPSKEWSDDMWWVDQDDRHPISNEGWWVFNEGYTQGRLLGGNLCTFNLLQGTEAMPSIKDCILFLEDDEECFPHHFDRDLQSVMHQPDFAYVKGLVIGRFQKESGMTREKLKMIIDSKPELKKIPVIANADFGHTDPFFTFPIGGKVRITAKINEVKIEILEH